MAVTNDLPGVEVTVEVNEAALKEYEDRDEEAAEKTHLRYIEAISGKEFSIKVVVKEDFKFKGDSITIWVWVDGIKVTGRLLQPIERIWTFRGIDSGTTTRLFRFDTLETVSDGHMTAQEATRVQQLGNLEVKVFHTRKQPNGAWGVYTPVSTHSRLDIVSEKALKGQSLSHSVGTGSVVVRPQQTTYPVTYIDGYDSPGATFIFRYRSLDALKSMLIIPREPTPPPLEEKDPADLTADDIKELLRRAREAKGLEDTKQKIKRERADNNPRPRKVSRPSAGDTQFEIGDDGSVRESSTATLGRQEHEIIELD